MLQPNESILQYRQRLGRPLVMGHRGAMGYAPENTMASFELARSMGVDAIELDVHLSSDGHLVVIHDESVDRTTDGTGAVNHLTLAQLQALDAGAKFDPKFAGERIPTLEEVLTWAKGNLSVVIECKIQPDWEQVVEALVALVDRLDVSGQVAFISFDHMIPRGLKQRRPNWQAGALYVGRMVDPVGVAGAALANGVLPHFFYLSPELTKQMHAEGKWVGTWCPNSEPELQYAIAMGADMIGTNYPDRLQKLLGLNTAPTA
jgi:glycerophosphoryl diester phosphodiesterase